MRSWPAIAVLAAGVAATLAACGDRSVEQMTAIKDKVCACKTSSCAEQELKLVPEHIASTHRTQVIARDVLDCLARLQAAERPTTDPDAEGPEGAEGAHAEDEVPAIVPRIVAPASAKTQ